MSESEPKIENTTECRLLNRRDFLAVSGSALALGVWDGLARAQPRPGQAASPENTEEVDLPVCKLRLDRRNGNLIGLAWKEPSIEVIMEPRLGENFRILLPRAEYQANYFTSSGQEVRRIDRADDGVTCIYETLRNNRESLDVKSDIKSVQLARAWSS
jgi:hypothetical protein